MMKKSPLLFVLLAASTLDGCKAPVPGASEESSVDANFKPDTFASGSGTGNHLTKWKSDTSLENSTVFEIATGGAGGGNVGIGTTTPQARLDVIGLADQSAIIVPRDIVANRPSTAVNGMLRYASDTGNLEAFMAGIWQVIASNGANQNFLANVSIQGTLSTTGTSTFTGASTFNSLATFTGGATISGAALTMSSQNITGVGTNITGAGALTVAAGGAAQDLTLVSSTSGSVNIGSGNGTSLSVLDGGAATANFVTIQGAAAAGSPVVGTAGAGANINLTFTPKGTGNTLFSTGNVGMGAGAAIPETNLDLAGAGATLNGLTNTTMQIQDTTAMAADVGGKIAFSGQDGGALARFAALAGRKETGVSGNNAGYLAFFTRADGANLTEQMRITSAGNVGIGTTPTTFKLDVNGTIRGFGITDSSDIRLKRDVHVRSLEQELEKVLRLQGVSYYWRSSDHGPRKQLGFIAQDVEKEFPELVETDKEGMKSMNYSHLIAPVVNALKALYTRMESLVSRTRNMDSEIAQLKAKIEKSESENAAIKSWICSKDLSAPFCK